MTETEKLARLCERLKYKHAREPVILLIDENIITSTEDLPAKVGLKDSDDFHIISAVTSLDPLIEKYAARDPGQNIQVYLTYREDEERKALLKTVEKNRVEKIEMSLSKFDELGKFWGFYRRGKKYE